jgi:hypothetical protein
MPSCATLALSAFRGSFIEVSSWYCHTQRTPAGEIDRLCRLSASETRYRARHARAPVGRYRRLADRRSRYLICYKASSPPFSYSSLNR